MEDKLRIFYCQILRPQIIVYPRSLLLSRILLLVHFCQLLSLLLFNEYSHQESQNQAVDQKTLTDFVNIISYSRILYFIQDLCHCSSDGVLLTLALIINFSLIAHICYLFIVYLFYQKQPIKIIITSKLLWSKQFSMIYQIYQYILLIPFLEASLLILQDQQADSGKITASIINLIITILLGAMLSIHQINCRMIVSDHLETKNQIYNIIFFIFNILLVVINRQSSNKLLNCLAHLLVCSIRLVHSYILKIHYFCRDIQLLYFQCLISYWFVTLSVIVYSNNDYQSIFNILVIWLAIIPLSCKIGLNLHNLADRNYEYLESSKINGDAQFQLYILKKIQFIDVKFERYFQDQTGIVFENVYANHVIQCNNEECHCRHLQSLDYTLWQNCIDSKSRRQFFLKTLKNEIQEYINTLSNSKTKKRFAGLGFSSEVQYLRLKFLLDVEQLPIPSYLEIFNIQQEYKLQKKKTPIYDQLQIDYARQYADEKFTYFFSKVKTQNQRLQFLRVLEFDEYLYKAQTVIEELFNLKFEIIRQLDNDKVNLKTLQQQGTELTRKTIQAKGLLQQCYDINFTSQKLHGLTIFYQFNFDLRQNKVRHYALLSKDIMGQYLHTDDLGIDLFNNRSCIIFVSFLNPVGTIKGYNQNFLRLFNFYEDQAIKGQNVNLLMPEFIAIEHDRYLYNYVEQDVYQRPASLTSFAVAQKNPFIFPVKIRIKQDFYRESDFGMSAHLELGDLTQEYILLSKAGNIQNMSFQIFCNCFAIYFNEDLEQQQKQIDNRIAFNINNEEHNLPLSIQSKIQNFIHDVDICKLLPIFCQNFEDNNSVDFGGSSIISSNNKENLLGIPLNTLINTIMFYPIKQDQFRLFNKEKSIDKISIIYSFLKKMHIMSIGIMDVQIILKSHVTQIGSKFYWFEIKQFTILSSIMKKKEHYNNLIQHLNTQFNFSQKLSIKTDAQLSSSKSIVIGLQDIVLNMSKSKPDSLQQQQKLSSFNSTLSNSEKLGLSITFQKASQIASPLQLQQAEKPLGSSPKNLGQHYITETIIEEKKEQASVIAQNEENSASLKSKEKNLLQQYNLQSDAINIDEDENEEMEAIQQEESLNSQPRISPPNNLKLSYFNSKYCKDQKQNVIIKVKESKSIQMKEKQINEEEFQQEDLNSSEEEEKKPNIEVFSSQTAGKKVTQTKQDYMEENLFFDFFKNNQTKLKKSVEEQEENDFEELLVNNKEESPKLNDPEIIVTGQRVQQQQDIFFDDQMNVEEELKPEFDQLPQLQSIKSLGLSSINKDAQTDTRQLLDFFQSKKKVIDTRQFYKINEQFLSAPEYKEQPNSPIPRSPSNDYIFSQMEVQLNKQQQSNQQSNPDHGSQTLINCNQQQQTQGDIRRNNAQQRFFNEDVNHSSYRRSNGELYLSQFNSLRDFQPSGIIMDEIQQKSSDKNTKKNKDAQDNNDVLNNSSSSSSGSTELSNRKHKIISFVLGVRLPLFLQILKWLGHAYLITFLFTSILLYTLQQINLSHQQHLINSFQMSSTLLLDYCDIITNIEWLRNVQIGTLQQVSIDNKQAERITIRSIQFLTNLKMKYMQMIEHNEIIDFYEVQDQFGNIKLKHLDNLNIPYEESINFYIAMMQIFNYGYIYILFNNEGKSQFFITQNFQVLYAYLRDMQNIHRDQTQTDLNEFNDNIQSAFFVIEMIGIVMLVQIFYFYKATQDRVLKNLQLLVTFTHQSLMQQLQHLIHQKLSFILMQSQLVIQPKGKMKRQEIELKQQQQMMLTLAKKKQISETSAPETLSRKLILFSVINFALITFQSLYSLLNNIAFIKNFSENIDQKSIINSLMVQISAGYSVNYLAIRELATNAQFMNIAGVEDEGLRLQEIHEILHLRQQIADDNQQLIDQLYVIQSDFIDQSNFKSQSFYRLFNEAMEKSICNLYQQNKGQFNDQFIINDSLQLCISLQKGILNNGIISTMQHLIQLWIDLQQIFDADEQPQYFKSKMIQFDKIYNISETILMLDFLQPISNLLNEYTIDECLLKIDAQINITLYFLIVALLIVVVVFLPSQIAFLKFLQQQLQESKQLLQIFNVDEILSNSYITSFINNQGTQG